MRKTEDIVCYDFQGWPEYKMNLREILLALGGQQDGNFIKFPSNTPLMDIYPRILVDDGMGYGVDESEYQITYARSQNSKQTEKPSGRLPLLQREDGVRRV